MPFKTPEQYQRSIQDGRAVYSNGQKITDLAQHPLTGPMVQYWANLYTYYHDPEMRKLFVARDPESGEEADRFMVMPRSADDLLMRAKAIDEGSRRYGALQFLSDGLLALRWVSPQLAKANPRYAENILHFERVARQNNQMLIIAMSDVKGDRSKHPSEQSDPDLYVRKVRETKDGIVIRGMKAHVSGAPFCHEMIVLPTKRMRDNERDYSVACIVAPNTPGVKLIMRADPVPGSALEFPLEQSSAGGECLVWFDDVLVPWERVFQNGENQLAGPIAYALGLWQRYSSMCYHKSALEQLTGAAYLLAKYNGLERVPHIEEKLFNMAMVTSATEAFIQAAAMTCDIREGVAVPNETITNIGKYMFANSYHQIVKDVQDIGGAIVTTHPHEADWNNPELRPALEKYLTGGDKSSSEQRLRLWNFVRELTADRFGGHQSVTTLHAEGSLAAQKMMTVRGFDFERAAGYVKKLAGITEAPMPKPTPPMGKGR